MIITIVSQKLFFTAGRLYQFDDPDFAMSFSTWQSLLWRNTRSSLECFRGSLTTTGAPNRFSRIFLISGLKYAAISSSLLGIVRNTAYKHKPAYFKAQFNALYKTLVSVCSAQLALLGSAPRKYNSPSSIAPQNIFHLLSYSKSCSNAAMDSLPPSSVAEDSIAVVQGNQFR